MTNTEKKIEEAQTILRSFGLPDQQQNKVSALTLDISLIMTNRYFGNRVNGSVVN